MKLRSILACALFSVTALAYTAAAAAAATKPVLLVVAPRNIEDVEYLETRAALEKRGLAVEVASVSTDTAKGARGMSVTPNVAINDAKAEKYSAVVVIGGMGSITYLWGHEGLRSLLINAAGQGEYVGAICAAPATLARAGLLKGKSATGAEDAVDEMKKGGAAVASDAVVVDGKIVTGKGPNASADFGEQLAVLLAP